MNVLTRKTLNIPIPPAAKLKYKGIKVPKRAATYDIVNLINSSGVKYDIVTFRDKKDREGFGNILKRYIFKNFGWGESVTEEEFIPIKKQTMVDPETGKEILVKGRKIISIRKFKGKVTSKIETTQTVTEPTEGAPIVHIAKIEKEPMGRYKFENEKQSLFKYRKGEEPKGYKIHAPAKSPHGYMLDVFPMNFVAKNISEKAQTSMRDDRYMFLHLYSLPEFRRMAPTISEDQERPVKFPCTIRWFSDDNLSKKGRFQGDLSDINKKTIYLNRKALENRFDIVAKSAHEREHAYQFEQIVSLEKQKEAQDAYAMEPTEENLAWYRTVVEKLPVHDKFEARYYQECFNNYVNSDVDIEEYTRQRVERLAQKAELIAEQDYRKSVNTLRREFPYAPPYLIAGGDQPSFVLGNLSPIEFFHLMTD